MITKITYPNLHHGCNFLCFFSMNYQWVWEVGFRCVFILILRARKWRENKQKNTGSFKTKLTVVFFSFLNSRSHSFIFWVVVGHWPIAWPSSSRISSVRIYLKEGKTIWALNHGVTSQKYNNLSSFGLPFIFSRRFRKTQPLQLVLQSWLPSFSVLLLLSWFL